MCTLSWFKTAEGYELFFNRDEQVTRRRAELPEIYTSSSVKIIAPTDADAGGTWIAVNQYGLSLCLLNHYDSEIGLDTNREWVSRGTIVRELASNEALGLVELAFAGLDLLQFKPFRLFVLNPAGKSLFFTWDGKQVSMERNIDKPRTSSSYDPQTVRRVRKELFANSGLHDCNDRQRFLDFHASHDPEASAYSVCMHRDDANTVSLSHIVVDEANISFAYADGPPCQAPLSEPLHIPIVEAVEYDAA